MKRDCCTTFNLCYKCRVEAKKKEDERRRLKALSAPRKIRSGIKKKPTKKKSGNDEKMLAVCRNQKCYLKAVPCSGRVVPCHSNQVEHGKALGLKADDIFTVPGCVECHYWLDQGPAPKEEKNAVWNSAYEKWVPVRNQILNYEKNQ